jgi:histidyl-tRNA synthetase
VKFKSITGTRDILPYDSIKWIKVEERLRTIFDSYCYKEIRTPIFEETALFARGIGQATDIVGKEMYTFQDKGGTSLTLRPEMTASVIRSFIQHNFNNESMLSKVYYIGPVFRQERPQAGRYRQFHQFGVEAIGSQHPSIDAEIISIAYDIYNTFNIKDCVLKINSVGCPNCRTQYRDILKTELLKVIANLSEESKKRIETNPLRVLDSKDIKDKEATANVSLLLNYLCNECGDHLEKVKGYLDELEIKYIVDARIVRGLDYYTKTAFEIITTSLGSQDALAGGGRYDMLAEELGGTKTPAIGVAAGMERLMLMLEKESSNIFEDSSNLLFIVAVDDVARVKALRLANELRRQGLSVDLDFNSRSVKAQFREANRKAAKIVLVLSNDELAKGIITFKDMLSGEQKEVAKEQLLAEIEKKRVALQIQ